jgi:hypothetical protein
MAVKTIVCPKCEGTGKLHHYNHVDKGICYKCKGFGKIEISDTSLNANTGITVVDYESANMSLNFKWVASPKAEELIIETIENGKLEQRYINGLAYDNQYAFPAAKLDIATDEDYIYARYCKPHCKIMLKMAKETARKHFKLLSK